MLSVVSIALERAIHPAAWPLGENDLFIPQVFWYNSAIGPGRRWFAVSTNCPLPGETLNGNPRFRCCWVAVEFVTPLVFLLDSFLGKGKSTTRLNLCLKSMTPLGKVPRLLRIVPQRGSTYNHSFPGRRVLDSPSSRGVLNLAPRSRPGISLLTPKLQTVQHNP